MGAATCGQAGCGEARALGLNLEERAVDLGRRLLDPPLAPLDGADRTWMHERYRDVVPVVLGPALHAVETGCPIPQDRLDQLRAVAATTAGEPRSPHLATALHGFGPALQVFLGELHELRATPDQMLLGTSRAIRVAHELGTCWLAAWSAGRSRPAPVAHPAVVAGEPVELVVDDEELEQPDKHMLALAARGLSNEEIAEETSYSRQTVNRRLTRLMKQWDAPNRTALVAVALLRGAMGARTRQPTRRDGNQARRTGPPGSSSGRPRSRGSAIRRQEP